MANETKEVTGAGKKGEMSPALKAAQEARRRNAVNGQSLSDEESFALRMVQQAAKACKMIGKRIRAGKYVEPEVLRACSTLSGAMASMLHD